MSLARRVSGRLAAPVLTALLLPAAGAIRAAPTEFIVVQSTSSTEDSGLFGHILPLFRTKTGIEVRIVAVGTGQAIRNARNGDGDVLLVHARPAEDQFVAGGWGVRRYDVMYNDFVLVGPASDPAGIAGTRDAAAALRAIANGAAPFVSRGDDSGTNQAERRLWRDAGIDVKAASGSWYRETGSGMGATLNAAVGMGAYTLCDRATWSGFRNKATHRVVVEGDPGLFNPYGVILVNPLKHPRVKVKSAQAFIDWLTGPEGQAAIAGFRINGQQQFFPSARGP